MKDRDLSRLLEDMVARILAEQSHEQSVRKLYVVFDEQWHHENYALANQLTTCDFTQVHAIVPKNGDPEMERRVKEIHPFLMQYPYGEEPAFTEHDCIVLPYIGRNDVIHIALGYSQSDLSEVIKKAFTAGASIYVLPTSIEPLSGKEPGPYQQMVQGYYQTIFELGIRYIDHIRHMN